MQRLGKDFLKARLQHTLYTLLPEGGKFIYGCKKI